MDNTNKEIEQKINGMIIKHEDGMSINIKRSCFGCCHSISEKHYHPLFPQDDENSVYCNHPSLEEKKYIGDGNWDTPYWCKLEWKSLLLEALKER